MFKAGPVKATVYDVHKGKGHNYQVKVGSSNSASQLRPATAPRPQSPAAAMMASKQDSNFLKLRTKAASYGLNVASKQQRMRSASPSSLLTAQENKRAAKGFSSRPQTHIPNIGFGPNNGIFDQLRGYSPNRPNMRLTKKRMIY